MRVRDLISRTHPGVHVNVFSSGQRFQASWVCDICWVVNLYKETHLPTVSHYYPISTTKLLESIFSVIPQSLISLQLSRFSRWEKSKCEISLLRAWPELPSSYKNQDKLVGEEIQAVWRSSLWGHPGPVKDEESRERRSATAAGRWGGGPMSQQDLTHLPKTETHTKEAYLLRGTSGKHLDNVHTWQTSKHEETSGGPEEDRTSPALTGQKNPEITPAGSDLRLQSAEYCENQAENSLFVLFFSNMATLRG